MIDIKNKFKSAWARICDGFRFSKEEPPAFLDSIRFYFIVSLLLELLVETLCRRSLLEAFKFLFLSPYAFLFCSLIILSTLSISMLLPFRAAFLSFISMVWIGFGVTDCILHSYRVTPFNVNDLQLISSVGRIFTVYLKAWQIVVICILAALVLVGIVFLFIRLPKYKIKLVKAACLIIIVAILIPTTFIIGTTTSLLSTTFPNLVDAYNEYGFPYCFVMAVFDRGVDHPDEYDDEIMKEITDELEKIADNDPAKKPNVIIVQLESFFNVNDLVNFEYSENPIYYFEQLKERYPSGKITVPSIGAGTVNTEFEVLSGMSLSYFGAGEYPYKTVLNNYTCETVAYNLLELGYSTHAIHNYEGTFYDRNQVYKQLGFESFTSMEYMKDLRYNASGTWPMDDILIGEITKALESTEGQDFIFAVSVQAHGKYPPTDISSDYVPTISVSVKEGGAEPSAPIEAWEYYINQIAEVDLFIKELTDAVMAMEEDTVLVFYGDHLPSLMIKDSDLGSSDKFQTEYIIVDNFSDSNDTDFGDIYAYQLSARVLEYVDINNGLLTKLHQNYSDKDFYQDWLNRLQYDMLGSSGKRYVYGGNYSYYPKMDSMKMGTDPITVTDFKYEDNVLYVYGENFTKWSYIVTNKKTCDETIFISDTMLVVHYGGFGSVEFVGVDQISDDGVHLSLSNRVSVQQPSE